MSVPKASVYQDHFISRSEYEIWSTGKIASLEPVAVSESVHKATDDQFRTRITRAHPPHDLRAALR